MIRIDNQMDGALLEIRLSGKIRGEDYKNILVPAVEDALSRHDRIRVLAIVEPDFTGYDLTAAWEDTKLGLGHWSGFERLAIVTGLGWVGSAIRIAAPILPCPVQVFPAEELEDARRWLRESLGSVHIIDLGGDCLQIKLLGKVDAEAYSRAEGDLDDRLRNRHGFRLLIDLTEFDGWQGLSALAAHFRLARDHLPLLERAAVVGDKNWQHMAQRVASHILRREIQYFPSQELDKAKAWLATD